MKLEEEAQLLSAESKPYNFSGNSGTSHKVRLNINGEIYVCKSNADQVSSLQSMIGKKGVASIKLDSRKEKLSMELLSFE